MLTLRDRDGELSNGMMKKVFCKLATESPSLRLDLTGLDAAPGFPDDRTNLIWLGFALGLRTADRAGRCTGIEVSTAIESVAARIES